MGKSDAASQSLLDDHDHDHDYDHDHEHEEEQKPKSFLEKMMWTCGCKKPMSEYMKPDTTLVLGLMVAVVIVGTANRVLFRKMLYPMANYAFFTNQLTSFIYIPVFWPVVWTLMWAGKITKEMREFPWWKFVVMGMLDSLAGLLMTFGGAHTNGSMQLLLSQAAIPFTMAFSIVVSLDSLQFIFKRAMIVRYKWNHYTGAVIIISGIFVSLYAQLFIETSSGGNQTVSGLIIYFMGSIPTAFSGVYKEIGFKGADLEVNYLNAWVAFWQFVIGMLFLPVTTFQSFGGLPFDSIPGNLWDGARCFMGFNSLPTDDCEGAGVAVMSYLVANIFYNVVILAMIKYGSAALLYVASALILPLADLCFTQSWIMGPYAQSLSIFDVIGLIVIILGLVIYRFLGGKESPADEEDGVEGENKPETDNEGEDEIEDVPIISFPISEVRSIRRRKNVRREHAPRDVGTVRNTYLARLGFKETPNNARAFVEKV
eukprot:TRINITY_DN601_c0_g1_i1.p1 TRINITY_DN601_c0_g1~~TRINITY_DN601_c0_g1_i1.p1  ORF type:complete len:525 (-),score=217.52 TRINITY_DN601_c0_g1_i1:76-1527(-)